MITGFQLDDKFTQETMACNRKTERSLVS